MKMYLKILAAVTGSIILHLPVNAQEIYKTNSGDVAINSAYNGISVSLGSNSVYALVNYETAEIEIHVNSQTLNAGGDTVAIKFASSLPGIMILKGKLAPKYINTQGHPVQKLNFKADFQLNSITKSLYIAGELKHLADNGYSSCWLTLNWTFKLSDFGITLPAGYSDYVSMQIQQTLLKRIL